MAAYILRRILWTVPVLLAVATITFVLMHSVPGRPVGRRQSRCRRGDETTSTTSTGWTSRSGSSSAATCGTWRRATWASRSGSNNRPVRRHAGGRHPRLGDARAARARGERHASASRWASRRRCGATALLDYAAVAFATAGASVPELHPRHAAARRSSPAHLHWLPRAAGAPRSRRSCRCWR